MGGSHYYTHPNGRRTKIMPYGHRSLDTKVLNEQHAENLAMDHLDKHYPKHANFGETHKHVAMVRREHGKGRIKTVRDVHNVLKDHIGSSAKEYGYKS